MSVPGNGTKKKLLSKDCAVSRSDEGMGAEGWAPSTLLRTPSPAHLAGLDQAKGREIQGG